MKFAIHLFGADAREVVLVPEMDTAIEVPRLDGAASASEPLEAALGSWTETDVSGVVRQD